MNSETEYWKEKSNAAISKIQTLIDSIEFCETEHRANYVMGEPDKMLLREAVEAIAQTTPPKDEWISVNDDRPPHLKTVWLCNREKGWVWLGCCVVGEDGYHWAASNGIIWSEKGEIVAECESDDLDVTHFCYLPPLPKLVN